MEYLLKLGIKLSPAGFKACGIWPINPGITPKEAYLPNTIYMTEDLTKTTLADKSMENKTEKTLEDNLFTKMK